MREQDQCISLIDELNSAQITLVGWFLGISACLQEWVLCPWCFTQVFSLALGRGLWRPACWQQLESVSRCELSSVLFGSLAALPLAPNTAVAWPKEQSGMCVWVCVCGFIHIHVCRCTCTSLFWICRRCVDKVQGCDSGQLVFLVSVILSVVSYPAFPSLYCFHFTLFSFLSTNQ